MRGRGSGGSWLTGAQVVTFVGDHALGWYNLTSAL
jgi:hypothetical protein